MKFVEKYQKNLDNGIIIIQILSYTISLLIISISIVTSIYRYVIEYINPNIYSITAFKHMRIDLAQGSALSLSFILGGEILKLFHIQTYKQLIIVISIVALKLLISYFLINEIESSQIKNNSII